MFALGIILWEMVNRVIQGYYTRPYGEFKNLQYDFQVIVKVSKENVRPTIPKGTPEELTGILSQAQTQTIANGGCGCCHVWNSGEW